MAAGLLQTIALTIFVGILLQVFAEKLRTPAIVFLMIAGVILGPQFLGLIHPEVFGEGLEVIISLSVALLLFEGGLLLNFKSYKETTSTVRNILSIGVLVTIAGAAILAHYIFGLNWLLSLLYGAFMSNAGITVINPILQRIRIKGDVANILRAEGILTKPIGTFVAIGILEIILSSSDSLPSLLYSFVWKILVGIVFGYLMGIMLGKLLKKRYIGPDLKNLVVLAWVFGTYLFSNYIESNTGILAVVVTGFAVQSENIPQLSTLKKFKGQLSVLAISIMFILVSANLDVRTLIDSGFKGLLVVILMIFVVRPIAVFASGFNSKLKFRDLLFISWIGPKGVVAASIASLSCIILEKQGIANTDILQSLSVMTVFITVLLQGSTAALVAKWCNVLVKSDMVIIVGANALGRTLATAFKEIGREVVLIDSNPEHCALAKENGFVTVNGNCLDENTLENAGLSKANIMIATTANSEINFLACQIAKEHFQIPEVYPAIDSPSKGVQLKLVDDIGGNLAYAKPVSIAEWKESINRSKVHIGDAVLHGEKKAIMKNLVIPNMNSDDWIPLILKRKNGYFFVHADQEWTDGDILIYLVRD